MSNIPSARIQEVSIKGDTFSAFLDDFDEILGKTLDNMRDKKLDEAEITVKMTVKARKQEVNAPTVANLAEKRLAVVPTFAHKISTVYKVESKVEGQLANGYELVYDDADDKWVLVEINSAQTSMFDQQKQGESGSVVYAAEGEVMDSNRGLPPPSVNLPAPSMGDEDDRDATGVLDEE